MNYIPLSNFSFTVVKLFYLPTHDPFIILSHFSVCMLVCSLCVCAFLCRSEVNIWSLSDCSLPFFIELRSLIWVDLATQLAQDPVFASDDCRSLGRLLKPTWHLCNSESKFTFAQ